MDQIVKNEHRAQRRSVLSFEGPCHAKESPCGRLRGMGLFPNFPFFWLFAFFAPSPISESAPAEFFRPISPALHGIPEFGTRDGFVLDCLLRQNAVWPG